MRQLLGWSRIQFSVTIAGWASEASDAKIVVVYQIYPESIRV
jgi:hypothetical protein